MHLLLVGISHRTAPVELRERVDFHSRGIERAFQGLAERVSAREAVVLSTCNRAELYAACDDLKRTRARIVAFVTHVNGRSVVVIGAGEMGKLAALHMKSHGVQHVTIISRTMAHAARTAEAIGGSAAPWDEMDGALASSDIVITATGSASPILTKARIE